jgi:hypothetical protein
LTTPSIYVLGSTLQVNGTLNGAIDAVTPAGSGGQGNTGNITIAGTHNGSLSLTGDSRATISGTHNGALNIAGSASYGASLAGKQNGAVNLSSGMLTLTDSDLSMADASTWSGGTITGTGSSQINVGSGATWAIGGGNKTLNGLTLTNSGTINLAGNTLTLNRSLTSSLGSEFAITASGTAADQYGRINANSIVLDPAGVNFKLSTSGGYALAIGDHFNVLSTTGTTGSQAVFSSGVINAVGPVNYAIGSTVSATGLTLDVTNFIPIAFPLPPGSVFLGAGSVSSFVQNQTTIGSQMALTQSTGSLLSTNGSTASITLP